MIDIKEAVRIAARHIKDLYEGQDLIELMLEEVELLDEDDEKYWLITLGFNRRRLAKHPLETIATLGQDYVRVYKVIKIRADTGEAVSMKIRTP